MQLCLFILVHNTKIFFMQLKIPSEEAIRILENRKSEIYLNDFDHKVWKGKTENDLKEIFDGTDFKWLQISHLDFEAPFTSEQNQRDVFQKGKRQAEKFLESYIEQIQEYSKIQKKQFNQAEQTYELKYYEIKDQMNGLIDKTNSLIGDYKTLQNKIENKDSQIQDLKKNTVQLNEITLIKLFHLIGNLPVIQIVTLISIIIAIITSSFFVGKEIQENISNNEQFDLREKNKDLTEKNLILEDKIKKLQLREE